MPRILDNIEASLLDALEKTLKVSTHSDFCVGYFNLRGWKSLDSFVDGWPGGQGRQCRLLVGMQKLPQDEFHEYLYSAGGDGTLDNQRVFRLKKKLAIEFRDQLTWGTPSNADEIGLRRLASQIKAGKVVVKLFLRHSLHAKLYLCFRPDPVNPIIGYLGSSNLTMPGLSSQGELNIDVMDHDATLKLARWFEDRWNDRWCVDISEDLVKVIEESWAREKPIPPFHIYVKMAYHLSQEARAGLAEFRIPSEFGNRLFDYQVAAVKIAAHHLNKRGGVLIGDVVGLGKTLMATALAKIFENDHGLSTLILCPPKLVRMWQGYVDEYGIHAKILPFSKVVDEISNVPGRFRLVLIDESHNLRNREGRRFGAIQGYIKDTGAKVILLSATPYNKTYHDLSSQLRLFVPEDKDVGIRPECLLKEIGEAEFNRRHQCPVKSLAAFEKSEHADDWRELMRLYMVRRTRGFIQENYATLDPGSKRKFLTFEDGTRSYFPERKPKTVKFKIDDKNSDDQYARLYAQDIVDGINALNLPRYGLANYIAPKPHEPPTSAEARQIQFLSRAGKRLMGFCRTNLFKRLESSGESFQQSIERHILRNYVYLHAIDNGLLLPIGTQDAGLLDSLNYDEDVDDETASAELFEEEGSELDHNASPLKFSQAEEFMEKARKVYDVYSVGLKSRFKWLRGDLFIKSLRDDLASDAERLMLILAKCGDWRPERDEKLVALWRLLNKKHSKEKVIVFTQFADTARYLVKQLEARGMRRIACATGDSDDPTALAWRVSPESNKARGIVEEEDELRVLVATDVLSEGQNLQDAAIVVNYDLPWAIIRLIQRAGRVDRIGQKSDTILCYSFLPADGVEKVIRLRARVRQRLHQNAEVVGTDEAFFEDEKEKTELQNLYNEKSGMLDGESETEVDLASYAYQIWKNAVDRQPALEKIIPELPDVVYSTRHYTPFKGKPEGVLLYCRTAEGNDSLAWIDKSGESVTESQFEILKAAECAPDTPSLLRQECHHELVRKGVELIVAEEKASGGQLGRPSGAKFKLYTRLSRYHDETKETLFEKPELPKLIEEVYQHPLRQSATDILNRQMRSGVDDERLAEIALALREEGRLCIIHEEGEVGEPRIICSMGLSSQGGMETQQNLRK